jgi:hypothetical protein
MGGGQVSILGKSSLSPTYTHFDPEDKPVAEPESAQEPAQPKRRGRPPGTKNKPKQPARSIPYFSILWATFWFASVAFSITALYFGVQGWLGQSAAYLAVAVAVPPSAYLLSRDWKKMRASR